MKLISYDIQITEAGLPALSSVSSHVGEAAAGSEEASATVEAVAAPVEVYRCPSLLFFITLEHSVE